jgi:hypothetical protein
MTDIDTMTTAVAAFSLTAEYNGNALLDEMDSEDLSHKDQLAALTYATAILLNEPESSELEWEALPKLLGLFVRMVQEDNA